MEKYNKISTRKFMKDLKEIDIFNAGMKKRGEVLINVLKLFSAEVYIVNIVY